MKNTRLYFFAYVKRLPTLNSFAFHFEIASGFPNEAKTHLEIPLFCKQSLRVHLNRVNKLTPLNSKM